MTSDEIQPGRTYAGRGAPRFVMWMSKDRSRLTYDSDSVGFGRHYPEVDTDRFAKWAKSALPLSSNGRG